MEKKHSKFKLIKLFPGSPQLGDIVESYNLYSYSTGTSATMDNGVKNYRTLNFYYNYSQKQIEDFPEFWQPVQEPLFTTEDGVGIYYETTSIYGVLTRDTWQYKTLPFSLIHAHSDDWKWFSSAYLRDQYIKENKPKYSKKNIKTALEYTGYDEKNYEISQLIFKLRQNLGL
jgi:hypothetical protein